MTNPIAVYDFTAHGMEPENAKKMLKKWCKKWTFQQEQGEKTGAIHLQGRFSLIKKKRATEVRKLFPGFHLSPTNKLAAKEDDYVSKEETRIAGPWRHDDPEVFIPDLVLKYHTYLPWQQKVLDIVKLREERIINVIIDKRGNRGKSLFSLNIMTYNLGLRIPFTNDYREMNGLVCSFPRNEFYIIDTPRAIDKSKLNEFYAAIEELKSGFAYDARYKGRILLLNNPTIWVFTNTEPPNHVFSSDRWRKWEINDNHELVPFAASFAPEHSPEIQDFEDCSSAASPIELIDYASLDNIKSDEDVPLHDVFTFPDGSIDDFDWDAPSKTE